MNTPSQILQTITINPNDNELKTLVNSKFETFKASYLDTECILDLYKECQSFMLLGNMSYNLLWIGVKSLIESNPNHTKQLTSNTHSHKSILVCDDYQYKLDDVTYDDKTNPNVIEINCYWKFPSYKIQLSRTYDILCINNIHTYGQLKRDLLMFGNYVNKYIIIYGTKVYGDMSEYAMSMNVDINTIEKKRNETMFSYNELFKGLNPAIEEFIKDNNEWKIHKTIIDNIGITILKK